MQPVEFFSDRPLAAITVGRAGMDLYPLQRNDRLGEATAFERHVGGSPANIAVAMARLGSAVSFLGRVSEDQVGRYVVNALNTFGVDTSHVAYDGGGSRTSLAFAELRPDDCDVLIYRNRPADLELCPADIDEDFLASAATLVVSGTALSASPSREAVLAAVRFARAHDTRVVLDIDYRPYSWRSPEEVSIYCGLVAERADIVIGNREEFDAMERLYGLEEEGGPDRDLQSARHWLEHGARLVIVKRGAQGCTAFDREGNTFMCPPFPVDVVKPVGAGDAFAGAMLHDLIRGEPVVHAVTRGAAAAALVVSRSSCSTASPTEDEVAAFLKKRTNHALAR